MTYGASEVKHFEPAALVKYRYQQHSGSHAVPARVRDATKIAAGLTDREFELGLT